MSISTAQEKKKKGFNDPIHGFIELHPLLVSIIDTPQFQRLRKIKQLGGKYFVYPGASHNRFEHSIGTCHLAGELARHLKAKVEERKIEDERKGKKKQKYPDITNEDILCVELAGLCHDLGHGPFSHVFDGIFLPEVKKRNKEENSEKWKHEKGSQLMFDYLLQQNNLKEMAASYGIGEKELQLVKDMIRPNKKAIQDYLQNKLKEWPYPEQEQKKFLFEVSSKLRERQLFLLD